MKKISIILFILAAIGACKQPIKTEPETPKQEVSEFDAELAKEYGADDYGMKKFVIAFLKRGPNRSQDSITAASLQRAHMDNIKKMAEAGKLVLAGPFFGDDDLRGIYVFDVADLAEAKALTQSDPAIQAGSLIMELREWYGSAALMGIPEWHKKIAKSEI